MRTKIIITCMLLTLSAQAQSYYTASGWGGTRNTNHWSDLTSILPAACFTNLLRTWVPLERDPSNNVPWQIVSYGVQAPTQSTAAKRPTWLGASFTFDGVDDQIGTSAVTISNSFTVAAWIKPSTTNTVQGIWARCAAGGQDYIRLSLSNNIVSAIYRTAHLGGIDVYAFAPNTTIPTNAWTHIVYCATNGLLQGSRMAINGVIQTLTITDDSNSFGAVASGGGFGAFQTGSGAFSNFFTGSMDDLMGWNIILTSTEMQQVYQFTNLSGRR